MNDAPKILSGRGPQIHRAGPLMSTQKNTDPEAWLADQLAQVQHPNAAVPLFTPGSAVFHTVERLAQEYGEMCAARATEGWHR